MSQRFANDTMRRAFSSPWAAVTFPGTTVRACTANSGELRASMMAMASSVPGSVSMITLRGPAAAAEAVAHSSQATKQICLNRTIRQLPLPASLLRSLGHDNQRQADQEAGEHRGDIIVRSLRRVAELLPD